MDLGDSDGAVRPSTHPVAAAALGRARLVALQGHAPFAVQQQVAVQWRAVLLGAGGPRQQGGQRVVGDHPRSGGCGWDGVSAAEHSDWTEAEVGPAAGQSLGRPGGPARCFHSAQHWTAAEGLLVFPALSGKLMAPPLFVFSSRSLSLSLTPLCPPSTCSPPPTPTVCLSSLFLSTSLRSFPPPRLSEWEELSPCDPWPAFSSPLLHSAKNVKKRKERQERSTDGVEDVMKAKMWGEV